MLEQSTKSREELLIDAGQSDVLLRALTTVELEASAITGLSGVPMGKMALRDNTKNHYFSCSQEEVLETGRMEHRSLLLDVNLFKIYISKVRRLGTLLNEEK